MRQHNETHCNSLQLTATHCNTLQHTATHCNTLQGTLCASSATHIHTHTNTLTHTHTPPNYVCMPHLFAVIAHTAKLQISVAFIRVTHTHAHEHTHHQPAYERGLQCIAVCCFVLQCIAVYCSVLQCIAVCCFVLQCIAVYCSVLQCIAVCCSVLQYIAVCCSVVQCVAGVLHSRWCYGVATIGRLLKIAGLFCRIQSLLQGSFAKETYHFKEPTSCSHPIVRTCSRAITHTHILRDCGVCHPYE